MCLLGEYFMHIKLRIQIRAQFMNYFYIVILVNHKIYSEDNRYTEQNF